MNILKSYSLIFIFMIIKNSPANTITEQAGDFLFSTQYIIVDDTLKPIGTDQESGNVPSKFMLYQNFPNPFNPTTNIKFDIAKKTLVKLTIFDITGGVIDILVNEVLDAGSYEIDWNASKLSSGIYLYELETQFYSSTRKLILMK